MEVVSSIRFIRISPRKLRLLAVEIEKLSVQKALIALQFVEKKAATPLTKVIQAATADATHNFKLDEQKLVIKRIEVGEGPRLKRATPRSRGMSHPILKRTAHVKVTLQD